MRCCKALISISLHRVMDDAIFARTTVSTIASSDFRHLLRVDDFLGVATAGILWDIPISLTSAPGVCEMMTLKVNWIFIYFKKTTNDFVAPPYCAEVCWQVFHLRLMMFALYDVS